MISELSPCTTNVRRCVARAWMRLNATGYGWVQCQFEPQMKTRIENKPMTFCTEKTLLSNHGELVRKCLKSISRPSNDGY